MWRSGCCIAEARQLRRAEPHDGGIGLAADDRRQQAVVRGEEARGRRAVTAMMSREVPTPGSTTAMCTVPAREIPEGARQPESGLSRPVDEISWVRSTIRAPGSRLRMTPFMTPTNGPWCPKSVVIVMTPEGGLEKLMRQAGAGFRLADHVCTGAVCQLGRKSNSAPGRSASTFGYGPYEWKCLTWAVTSPTPSSSA